MLGQLASKGAAPLGPLAGKLQGPLRRTDEPHAVVDAPWPEPALGNFETPSFSEEKILRGYAHVFEVHLGVAEGRVVVAKGAEGANDADPRGVLGNKNLAVALVAILMDRVRDPHDDKNLRSLVGRIGDEPLLAVDAVVIAVPFYARFD